MSNIRQSQTKLASEYLILIRTFLSQPYIHPGMQFFVHSLSEHHVVMIESSGNIRFFTGTPNIPPTFYHNYMMFRLSMNKKYKPEVYIRLTEESSIHY